MHHCSENGDTFLSLLQFFFFFTYFQASEFIDPAYSLIPHTVPLRAEGGFQSCYMICHNYAPGRAMDLHFFLVFKRSICAGCCEQDVRFLQG